MRWIRLDYTAYATRESVWTQGLNVPNNAMLCAMQTITKEWPNMTWVSQGSED